MKVQIRNKGNKIFPLSNASAIENLLISAACLPLIQPYLCDMKTIWDFLKAVFNWLCSRPRDKYLHFIAGMIVAAFFFIVLKMEVCIVATFFAGFIKEFVDEWRYGGFDWKDLLATLLGGLVIQLFVLIS